MTDSAIKKEFSPQDIQDNPAIFRKSALTIATCLDTQQNTNLDAVLANYLTKQDSDASSAYFAQDFAAQLAENLSSDALQNLCFSLLSQLESRPSTGLSKEVVLSIEACVSKMAAEADAVNAHRDGKLTKPLPILNVNPSVHAEVELLVGQRASTLLQHTGGEGHLWWEMHLGSHSEILENFQKFVRIRSASVPQKEKSFDTLYEFSAAMEGVTELHFQLKQTDSSRRIANTIQEQSLTVRVVRNLY